jgi:Chemotaxis phosphatase CheX
MSSPSSSPDSPPWLPDLGDDLVATLADVLSTVLAQEAEPTSEPMSPGPQAFARLAIHDEATGRYAGIEIRISTSLAQVLASRMMLMADPAEDDIVDAVAELGNVVAGGVKSLLFKHARLSLPSAQIDAGEGAGAGSPAGSAEGHQQAHAIVLGHVVQVTVISDADPDGLLWPPVVSDELIGRLL